jgi:DivIVA domain-containing protein
MTFAPDDIEIKEFVPTLRGYDRAEVRAYLRAVAEDVRRLEERLNDRSVDEQGILGAAAATAHVPAALLAEVALRAHEPSAMKDLERAVRDLTFAIQAIAARTGLIDRSTNRTVAFQVPAEDQPPEQGPRVERRAASRPWSQPAADRTSSGRTNTAVDWSLPALPPMVAPRDRATENQSLIDRFLPVALGHAEIEIPTIGPSESDEDIADTEAAVLPFIRAV